MNYKIVCDNKPLKPFETPKAVHGEYSARQLLSIAKTALDGVSLYTEKQRECEFEDGRRQWMVSAFKYFGIKSQNEELKKQNNELKDQIRVLTGLKNGEYK